MKKTLALLLSVAMVMSMSSMVFAADSASSTMQGGGSFEGTVPEDVFSVVLPAQTNYTFIADPQGLIEATSAAKYQGAGITFSDHGTMYFKQDSGNAYATESSAYTITNKSTMEVDVSVAATVAANTVTGLTFVNAESELEGSTGGIYLAMVDSGDATNKAAILANGATLSGTADAVDSGKYEVTWTQDSGYNYGLKGDATEADFGTFSFKLTGATGGDWTAVDAAVAPDIDITWTVVPHRDVVDTYPTVTKTNILKNGVESVVPINWGAGTLEAESVAACKWNGQDYLGNGFNWNAGTKTLSVAASNAGYFYGLGSCTMTIVFDTDYELTVTVTPE